MFTFDKSDFQRFTVSAVGALALSAASVFAAVAPVKAATTQPTTVDQWRGAVEQQIDGGFDTSLPAISDSKAGQVTVSLDFTADGDFALAGIARSSGNKAVDASALKVARQTRYPALPVGMRGAPQKIEMNLYFGRSRDAVDQAQRAVKSRDRQFVAGKGIQLAAR